MNYRDFIILKDKPEDLVKKLKSPQRDSVLSMHNDYYEGVQWRIGSRDQSRVTRSGREMWKPFGDDPTKGHTKGELKTWNIIKPTINTWVKYTRGDDKQDIKIRVSQNDKLNEELTTKANNIFGDLNEFIVQAAKKQCIDSVVSTKYTAFGDIDSNDDLEADEQKIMQKIKMDENLDTPGMVEIVNTAEVTPIYWRGHVRGFIRFYRISKDLAENDYGFKSSKADKDPLYYELWYIDDKADVKFEQYIEAVRINEESNESPYDFLPYVAQEYDKSNKHNFDLEHLENCIIDDLIELQDDLNAYETDLGIILRQVAIPLLKMTDEFIKAAKAKDISKVKKELQLITTYAGQIITAPVERMQSADVPDSQMSHYQHMMDQYGKTTSIPKSVLNSEGLANVATETVEFFFQSLRTVVAVLRTNLSLMVIQNVKMMLVHLGQYDDSIKIEVVFPEMFPMSKQQKVNTIFTAKDKSIVSAVYATKEILTELGDSDKETDILAELTEQDAGNKLKIDLLNSARQPVRDNVNNRNRDLNNPV